MIIPFIVTYPNGFLVEMHKLLFNNIYTHQQELATMVECMILCIVKQKWC